MVPRTAAADREGASTSPANTFTGTNGFVTALGGNAYWGGNGGGGGGRIAVIYIPSAQSNAAPHSVTFSVAPAAVTYQPGGVGTIYFPDGQLLNNINEPDIGQIVFPGAVSNWIAANITISTNCSLEFMPGFQILVYSNFTISGAGHIELGSGSRIDVGNVLCLTNSGALAIHEGSTVSITNDMYIYEGSWVLPTRSCKRGYTPSPCATCIFWPRPPMRVSMPMAKAMAEG